MPDAPKFDPQKYKATTREQWQAAAEAWHRWGPTLSQWLGPSTELMLDMAAVGPGTRVLDVAAGAGEQTLTTARRVGPSGRVLATDISPRILDFALQEARRAGLTNVEARAMDGEALELPDASFDVVISRVGLIYFPDQQKALGEMKRVLVPGGRVAAIVYSTAANNEFFSVPVSIIRRRAALGPPLPGQPGPFSLGNEGVLEEAFRKAGFQNVQARRVPSPLRLPKAEDCLRFEKESFGALHQMLSSLDPPAQHAAWDEIGIALRKFETAEGFKGPCEMVVAVGTK
jgi:ubiquinone/menaquinone biosynthesis C-methylase UbiE